MTFAFVHPTHGVPGDSRRDVGLWYRWLARLVASILAVPVFPRASRRILAVDRTLTRAKPGFALAGDVMRLADGEAWPDTAWTIARGSRTTFLPAATTALRSGRPAPLSTPTLLHHVPGVESPLDGIMVAIDETRDTHQRKSEGNPGCDPGGRPVR